MISLTDIRGVQRRIWILKDHLHLLPDLSISFLSYLNILALYRISPAVASYQDAK
jgi:hypothetical protein